MELQAGEWRFEALGDRLSVRVGDKEAASFCVEPLIEGQATGLGPWQPASLPGLHGIRGCVRNVAVDKGELPGRRRAFNHTPRFSGFPCR